MLHPEPFLGKMRNIGSAVELMLCSVILMFDSLFAAKFSSGRTGSGTTTKHHTPGGRLTTDSAKLSDFSDCQTGASVSSAGEFPDIGREFQIELEGTYTKTNMTYTSITIADAANYRGAVATNIGDRKELLLYDYRHSRMFRVHEQNCVEEALDRTSCNPLAYFLLHTANKTTFASHCQFEAAVPSAVDSRNETIHGNRVYKWKQCLGLHIGKQRFIFLMNYSFQQISFIPVRGKHKYIPLRLQVDQLYPAPGYSSSKERVVFDFTSFFPFIRNRSMLQAGDAAECPGWNVVDTGQ